MTTYNTGNPVPSGDARDRFDNSQTFDEVVTGPNLTAQTRLGEQIKTLRGFENTFDLFLQGTAFELPALVYVDGVPLQVDRATQLIERAGLLYSVKLPQTFPLTLSGTWATDEPLLTVRNDQSLRQDLADPTGAGLIGFGTQTVEDVLQGLPVSLPMPDGVTDDMPNLVAALAQSNHVILPPSDLPYNFKTAQNFILGADTVIDFNGQVCVFDNGRISLKAAVSATGRTLTVNAARYATQLQLNDTTGIQRGDILYVTANIAPSNDWSDKKQDAVKVKNVIPPFVDLEQPINFHYDTVDAGLAVSAYRSYSLTLKDANNFLVAADSDTTPRVMVDIYGMKNVHLIRPSNIGQRPFDRMSNIYRVGIQTISCVDVLIDSPYGEAMSYPIGIYGGTRNIVERNVRGVYNHHSNADCGGWSCDYYLLGMISSSSYQSFNTHPVLRAYAENVTVTDDFGLPNWRTVGGGLRNVVFTSVENDAAEIAQYQNAAMKPEYAYLYSDADFYLDNVDARTPNRITKAPIAIAFGRNVTVSNCKMNDLWVSFITRNDVQNLIIGAGNRFGDNWNRTPGKALIQCKTRIDTAFPLDANLISGVYHVDPRAQMVQHGNGRLLCSGSVFTNRSAASPVATSLVLHVNAFSEMAQTGILTGKLKLFATVHHQSGGVFSTQEKHFNFDFIVQATSLLSFPTTAVYTSGLSGQAGEGVVLTISAPSGSGESQVGPNGDHTITVPITLTAAGSTPKFSLSYELELNGFT
ncbi:hypothetical protein D3C77_105970 [compost metagenome]